LLSRYALCAIVVILSSGCGRSEQPVPLRSVATADASALSADRIRAIYSFEGFSGGESPNSNIVAPTSAPHYPQIIGSTEFGGGSYGLGTVYGLTQSKTGTWTEAVLYSMHGSTDGWRPNGIAIPGHLDGTEPAFVTSFAGGASGNGAIAVLRPNPSGSWTLLSAYSFAGYPDGAAPFGPVVPDQHGNLYGTTYGGGLYNEGTVYRLQPNNSNYTESIVYNFQGGSDGAAPRAGLTIDREGALYGTTQYGGEGNAGDGTVFKLTPSASGFTESVLHRFGGNPDGSQPYAGVCVDQWGALYGTTALGGTTDYGTAFKLTPNLAGGYMERVLWSFGSVHRDGIAPEGNVIVANDGEIYGTTINGGRSGPSGSGTIFTLKRPSSGNSYVETLFSFNGSNGAGPSAGPTTDSKGDLYVPTLGGGAHLFGTVAETSFKVKALSCR